MSFHDFFHLFWQPKKLAHSILSGKPHFLSQADFSFLLEKKSLAGHKSVVGVKRKANLSPQLPFPCAKVEVNMLFDFYGKQFFSLETVETYRDTSP